MDKEFNQHWGTSLVCVLCENCDRRYVKPQSLLITRCPNCHLEKLKTFENSEVFKPAEYHPECYLPYVISTPRLRSILEEFTRDVPFSAHDMDCENILARKRYIFLPQWLVDTQLQARWQAEIGFDYKVMSHEDRYDDRNGGWVSRKLEETRVRWESRLGSLDRTYHNVRTAGIEDKIDP